MRLSMAACITTSRRPEIWGRPLSETTHWQILNKIDEPHSADLVEIVGPLCTPLDTLGRSISLPPIEAGDLVGVFQSGAYARAASPLGFLSHPTPAEVIVSDKDAHLIRRRGLAKDLLEDQQLDSTETDSTETDSTETGSTDTD